MKLVCPSCGLTASAEAWINDAAARELLLAVAILPSPLPKATLPYLGLFRPEKQALRWEKALKIVSGLAQDVGLGHIQAPGKVARPCPPRIWAAAMEQMVERRDSIRRPLPNHNYLKQVAWQLANEEDARGEAGRRTQEASGSTRSRVTTKPSIPGEMSPMDSYIQGHRDDKPSEEEMQEWRNERMR